MSLGTELGTERASEALELVEDLVEEETDLAEGCPESETITVLTKARWISPSAGRLLKIESLSIKQSLTLLQVLHLSSNVTFAMINCLSKALFTLVWIFSRSKKIFL